MSSQLAAVWAQAVVARPHQLHADGFQIVAGGQWPAQARSAVLDLCAAVVDLDAEADQLRGRVADLERELAECGREAA